MTDADTDTLRRIVSEDAIFTHMSGRQQTREEYFADIENGSLRYFTIGINHPVIEVDGDLAAITYTSVLNANAYGARGTYRMGGTHYLSPRDYPEILLENLPNMDARQHPEEMDELMPWGGFIRSRFGLDEKD